MKKVIFIFTIFLSFFIIINNVDAQAFQKGNKNFDLGVGLGIYKTTTSLTVSFPWFGGTTQSLTVVEEDGAASTIIPLTFEYGISNKFGIGAQLGVSNYFIDNEDSTETTESVKSIDFAILVNYHLLNSDKNDLFIGLSVGSSSVTWLDLSGEGFSGSGSFVSLYIKDRVFFNDNVGILFNFGYTAYNYNQLESTVSNPFITEFKWQLGGVNIGTGLALKF
jgi:hypothetical protein